MVEVGAGGLPLLLPLLTGLLDNKDKKIKIKGTCENSRG
jgi:hypothetical protein